MHNKRGEIKKKNKKLLRGLIVLLIIGLAIFIILYLIDQKDPGPILDDMRFPPDYEKAKGQSVQTKCNWRPNRDYGICELLLGVYYDGEECKFLSGCSDKGDKIPFDSIEECEALLPRC